MTASPIDEENVRAALRQVIDPEVGLNVVDLGLVYAIAIEGQVVRVDMALTSAACPLGPYLLDEATEAIRDIVPQGMEVDVRLVDDPPWTPDRMSDLARGVLE
jgi:metal-sulfur cluster biosynthetic enzyme